MPAVTHPAGVSPPIRLYLIRGAIAILWAIAFSTASGSLTTTAAILVVAYPVIDLVASAADARRTLQQLDRRLLTIGASLSALAAVALAIAGTGDIADVLRVFGIWAIVAGLAQVSVAFYRRGAESGGQWPMLLAGTFSVIVGVVYEIRAGADNPKLGAIAGYAAAGGVFFIVQAAILTRRRRHAGALPA